MESRISASGSASVECVAVVEIAAVVIESIVIEIVAVDDRAAVGDVGVMVVSRAVTVPIIIPVVPTPPKPSEETDSKSTSEKDRGATIKNSGHGHPARVSDHGISVYEPWIVGRHVDHIRIGWLDDDGVALSRYTLLFVAIQLAGLLSLLAHHLDGIRHRLRLIGIGVTKR